MFNRTTTKGKKNYFDFFSLLDKNITYKDFDLILTIVNL